MIPKVKTWQVKFWTGQTSPFKGRIITMRVRTINKRFARWEANERAGYPAMYSNKITVGRVSDTSWVGPTRITPPTDAPFDVTKTTLGKFNKGTR